MFRKTLLSPVVGAVGLSLFCSLLLGCHASVRASGQASFSGHSHTGGHRVATSGKAEHTAQIRIFFKDGQLNYNGHIDFEYNKSDLKGEETFQVLEGIKKILLEKPEVKIRIEGRTDSRGTEGYNKRLSKQRAESILRWLANNGISKDRMISIGHGEEHAKQYESSECFNKTTTNSSLCEEQWSRSRQAVFAVISGEESLKNWKKDTPRPAPDTPELTQPAPDTPSTREERRRWYLGGHLGGAIDFDSSGGFFIGPDVGLWLSPRWALGISADLAARPSSEPMGRGLLVLEGHVSTGPGPDFWIGAGVGPGNVPNASNNSSLLSVAARMGVDFYTRREVRLGPFVEVAVHDGAGWVGFGFRLAYDFF